MLPWSRQKARAWHDTQPWICGCNFLPSSAVNFLEMWHEDSFDRVTTSRELGWAAAVGFNAVRVNLHSLIWEHDRAGLLARVEWFLDVASKQGIRTVFCLFDDCGFGGAEPVYGAQADPVPGVHNSRAVASPGRATVMDREAWPMLQRYVSDVLMQFGTDERVLFWDLYNEPGNRMIFSADGFDRYDEALMPHSLALMTAVFDWARATGPMQPLTVGAWMTPQVGSTEVPFQSEIDRRAVELSDIVTFHAYCNASSAGRFIDHLEEHGRPIFCTEWMARPVDSRIEDQLPLFRERGVGCFQWGFVKGRTQTHLPWPEALVVQHGGHTDRGTWFHDILYADGTPYDPTETALIRKLTGASYPATID